MSSQDLQVSLLSSALDNVSLDVVVSGSIGAMESVRFIRALRRLGADVFPWLTQGGAQFVTETALSWASSNPVTSQFSGEAPHIGFRDALVVAPASSNFISKAALGICDSPALALFASYLGQSKPVIIVPNMHDSLLNSPLFQENLKRLAPYVKILESREEEGKQKFPEPALLADHVAHQINSKQVKGRALVTMGTTRGYIDDVRYISNYSSGQLGTDIAEELYRRGYETTAVAGPSPIRPKAVSQLHLVETNDQMLQAALATKADAAVLAASVLDFVPDHRLQGKVSSQDELKVSFKKTEKIIAKVSAPIKVGFKLEAELDEKKAAALAEDYSSRYHLTLMVLNSLQEVSETSHAAWVFEKNADQLVALGKFSGKKSLARVIADHIERQLPALKRN